MIGKVFGIGMVAVLAVALVAGMAYILLRPATVAASNVDGGPGRPGAGRTGEVHADAESSAGGLALGNGHRQGGGGTGGSAGQGYGRGAGAGRQGGSATFEGVPEADHPAESWTVVDGTVVALVDDELTVGTGDGELTVHLGPAWYWEQAGIALDSGDAVELAGFYEDDHFEVGSIQNLDSGESAVLRDEQGRPLWAGYRRHGG